MISRFKKCDIYTLNRNQVLNRLPSEDKSREANLQIDKCLIDILKSASGKNDADPKRGKKISFAPGKDITVSAEKGTDSEVEQGGESENVSDMDIESEDELPDTDFNKEYKENHDPKQSSKAPVKDSPKVSEWVLVKHDIASSSKSKSLIQYFLVKYYKLSRMLCLRSHLSDHNIPTDVTSTNGQVVMILMLVTLIILLEFCPTPKRCSNLLDDAGLGYIG